MDFETGWGYYTHIWLPMTILTIPGGFIAYQIKRQNLLGGVVMGLGNTIQAMLGLVYLGMTMKNFPHHILSCLFCVASIIIMTLYIRKEKKPRLVALLLPIVLVAAMLLYLKATDRYLF